MINQSVVLLQDKFKFTCYLILRNKKKNKKNLSRFCKIPPPSNVLG